MAFQYSVLLRENQVAQLQATVGTGGVLKIFSGAEPTFCSSADPSGPLVTISLPSTFLTIDTGNGRTVLAGTWSAAATAAGTAASWRIYASGATVCHIQGNCSTDLALNNTSIASGQVVTVTSFQVTAGNS